jgi:porphobilinogen synthase
MWYYSMYTFYSQIWLIVDAGFCQPLSRRPRRNRKSPVMRASFQETSISPANFVYPLFIHEGWYFCRWWLCSSFSSLIYNLLLFLANSIFLSLHHVFLRFAGEEDTPIGAMPGCYRLGWRHGLVEEVVWPCLILHFIIYSWQKWYL